jgi:hypothetical protein
MYLSKNSAFLLSTRVLAASTGAPVLPIRTTKCCW